MARPGSGSYDGSQTTLQTGLAWKLLLQQLNRDRAEKDSHEAVEDIFTLPLTLGRKATADGTPRTNRKPRPGNSQLIGHLEFKWQIHAYKCIPEFLWPFQRYALRHMAVWWQPNLLISCKIKLRLNKNCIVSQLPPALHPSKHWRWVENPFNPVCIYSECKKSLVQPSAGAPKNKSGLSWLLSPRHFLASSS